MSYLSEGQHGSWNLTSSCPKSLHSHPCTPGCEGPSGNRRVVVVDSVSSEDLAGQLNESGQNRLPDLSPTNGKLVSRLFLRDFSRTKRDYFRLTRSDHPRSRRTLRDPEE